MAKIVDRLFVSMVTLGALPAMVVAAEEASGGHAEQPNLFAGDLGNVIWTLVIFIVLLAVLGKFAWGPILATLQRREQFIRESLEQAKRDREEAEKRLREHEERLRAAADEAAAIVEEGRRDAEATRRRIADETRREADDMISRAKREIGIARDTAVKELYGVVAGMATDVAGKLLRRNLSDEEHRRLLETSIVEVRDQVGGSGSN